MPSGDPTFNSGRQHSKVHRRCGRRRLYHLHYKSKTNNGFDISQAKSYVHDHEQDCQMS